MHPLIHQRQSNDGTPGVSNSTAAPRIALSSADLHTAAVDALGVHYDDTIGLAASIERLAAKHAALSEVIYKPELRAPLSHLIAGSDGERWVGGDHYDGQGEYQPSGALSVSPTLETEEFDELLCAWFQAMRKGTRAELSAATNSLYMRINLWRTTSVRLALASFSLNSCAPSREARPLPSNA
jgi:hypothetical protein